MSETESPTSAPQPPAPHPPRRRAARRLFISLAEYLLGTLLVIGALVGGLGWLLATEAGTAWLLPRLPWVQIEGVRGALFGDFEARSVELPLPDEDASLRLQDLRWRNPGLHAVGLQQWFRISLDELAVRRIDLRLSSESSSGPASASTPPQTLALPIGLDIASVRVGEFHIDGLDTPLREVQARLSLGADDGALHRVEALQLAWDRLELSGAAQVATQGSLDVDAQVDLRQQLDEEAAWNARLSLAGPLAKPQLQVQLRARATPRQPEQTLDAKATLEPFATWPLGELQATARAFDLSALHSAAPSTTLDLDATAITAGLDQTAAVSLRLSNRSAGAWNEGRLPLRRLALELHGRPDDPGRLELPRFDAELGTARTAAGTISGSGQWQATGWQLLTRLSALQPAVLDVRAPGMRLDGQLRIDGTGFDANAMDAAELRVRGQLDGRLLERGPPQPVQVRLDASLNALRIELHEVLAQAGNAQATLDGRLTRPNRRAGWAARGKASLHDFDPLPWWPGREDSPWRQGPHRLNGAADFDLSLPAALAEGSVWRQLGQLQGDATLRLEPSRLAGVPLSGSVSLQSAAQAPARVDLKLDAAENKLSAQARLALRGDGEDDRWEVQADLPALNRLLPLWRLLPGAGTEITKLAGSLTGQAQLDGRWPAVRTQGQLHASGLQLGDVGAQTLDARWQLGSRGDAPLEASIEGVRMTSGKANVNSAQLQLKGKLSAHTLELRADAKALPPAWVDRIQAAPASAVATRTLGVLQLHGAATGASAQSLTGWRGRLDKLDLRSDAAGALPWVGSSEFAVEVQWADGPLRAKLGAGRATLLGAGLTWSRVDWSAADPGRAPALLDAEARIEPLAVAPLLARLQPGFGWGGDLQVGGNLKVKSAPAFSADVVLERSGGDLNVTDDSGTRSLGLSDLRIGVNASDGVWSFTAGLAGKTLGQAAGAVVARTSPRVIWPTPDAPIDGVLELQIADLGVWGPWLPPGWRLGGAMHANASFGGRFGAPEYVGELTGQKLIVRNLLQGVEVRDGDVAIALLGDEARIERFQARAGAGTLTLTGSANLGAAPQAELKLLLDHFQLLGRVDRRIITSGDAVLRLGRETLALEGDFLVNEGLIDFSRSDAPTLSADVHVQRGDKVSDDEAELLAAEANAAARARQVTLDLRVRLGTDLRLRGQGLDTGLRGDLRLSAPAGRLRVDGSVQTAGGTYRAYRQRLNIERGVLTFNGPVENPQLDIEAIRPNLDVRVGVAVTGTVLVPRVRLFSEPEMSDADKLSWLLRGRASEGQGTADTALLQAAAMALLAGDEPSVFEQLFNVIGLDDLSLRQSESAGGGAIVSVGKQLSRNWYVGYERGLNATTGNWQLIYRIAQRFTVRAQSGEQNSLELIWSWRWQ